MQEQRSKRAWAWVPVALLVFLVGYPLSFGPACWIVSRVKHKDDKFGCADMLNVVYLPVRFCYVYSPLPVKGCIHNYANLKTGDYQILIHPNRIAFWQPADSDGVSDGVLY